MAFRSDRTEIPKRIVIGSPSLFSCRLGSLVNSTLSFKSPYTQGDCVQGPRLEPHSGLKSTSSALSGCGMKFIICLGLAPSLPWYSWLPSLRSCMKSAQNAGTKSYRNKMDKSVPPATGTRQHHWTPCSGPCCPHTASEVGPVPISAAASRTGSGCSCGSTARLARPGCQSSQH